MNDFDYDVMLKKRIARGAIAKKNGCKSKKCTLPQDYMTAAELKRRNGKTATYEMNKPMKWQEFKSAPADIQKEYVTRLRDCYNASDAKIAEMLGVSGCVVSQYFKRNSLQDGIARRMSKLQCLAWDRFLHTGYVPETENTAAVEKSAEQKTVPAEEKLQMDYFHAILTGNVYVVCKKIVEILGANTTGEITITFRSEKEASADETF